MPDSVSITIDAKTMEGLSAKDPQVIVEVAEHSPIPQPLFRNVVNNFDGNLKVNAPMPPGFPTWQVNVTFSKYDAVSGFFFQPRANSTPSFSVQVTRLPGQWKPAFTKRDALSSARFERFRTVVAASADVDLKKNGAPPVGDLNANYDALADPDQIQGKMALLNLYSVLTDEQDPIAKSEWFSHVNKIVRLDQERFIAEIDGALYENAQQILSHLDTTFRGRGFFSEPPADLLLHIPNFPARYGVGQNTPMLTLKKEYEQGDVQLTLAQATVDGAMVHLLDCDMDENRNILLHSLDLLKHLFNGGTSPITMHEYIVEDSAQTSGDGIAHIDLGYVLGFA